MRRFFFHLLFLLMFDTSHFGTYFKTNFNISQCVGKEFTTWWKRGICTLQANNFQKASFVYRFIKQFVWKMEILNDCTDAVWNNLTVCLLKRWTKGTFTRLLTCTKDVGRSNNCFLGDISLRFNLFVTSKKRNHEFTNTNSRI